MLRLNFVSSAHQTLLYQKLSKIFLSQTLFLTFLAFTSLNYLLDFYQEVFVINFSSLAGFNLFFTFGYNKFINLNAMSLNLLDVYTYPFIYVFLLITSLSIIFCLSYNRDELFSFMFYCQVILFAGYMLFFTDSLIIFFFSYEMLLVPSRRTHPGVVDRNGQAV